MSHDATDTLPWADEILVLRHGQLVQQGPPARIYQQPADEYTAALFGDYNLLRGADRRALAPHTKRQSLKNALLVRPEQFTLGPAEGHRAGTVRAVRFFGGYYEVEVALSEQSVRVRTGATALVPGDAVTVAVAGSWSMASGT